MKKIVLLVLVMVALTGCFNKVSPEKVIAKVGSKVYSIDDINKRIGQLDPQLKTYFQKKENKVRLLDQIIEEEIIYQVAKKEGIQRDKGFKENLRTLKRQALINYFIQQKVEESSVVTKVEVENFFNSNKDKFSTYETRNISHILVEKKDTANKVKRALKKGGDFGALAKQYSIDPSKAQGGKLGWVRKTQLVPEFANVAFKLTKKTSLSGIVKTQFGYHVIQYNGSRTVPAQTLEQVYDAISAQIQDQKKRDTFKQILDSGKETVKVERTIENL